MSTNSNDTIAAQATPAGRGGIGIIRLSGPGVKKIALAILGELPKPRYAAFHTFKNEKGSIIDKGLALFFEGPHSFTGEDVLELHGHGGPVVMDALLRRVLKAGARMAKPGEFSERAFLNNKLDLAQAESIADLINAGSEEAARCAIRSLQGDFSKRVHELVAALIELRKWVEACIDFPEEDIDFLKEDRVEQALQNIIDRQRALEASAQQGALLQTGMTVVIAGKPNVGKSSLLNQLSGRDAAIVTSVAGTTRDVLRERINLDGMPLHIVDTAGLHHSDDIVEQEGMRRAQQEIENADVILLMIEEGDTNTSLPGTINPNTPTVVIKNKIDLTGELPEKTTLKAHTQIKLSAKTAAGIDLLKEHLKKQMGYRSGESDTFIARRRHLEALAKAKHHLEKAWVQLHRHHAGELLAEDLRLAQNALSEITGEFTSDELLGEIFSSFCIGK